MASDLIDYIRGDMDEMLVRMIKRIKTRDAAQLSIIRVMEIIVTELESAPNDPNLVVMRVNDMSIAIRNLKRMILEEDDERNNQEN